MSYANAELRAEITRLEEVCDKQAELIRSREAALRTIAAGEIGCERSKAMRNTALRELQGPSLQGPQK